MAAVALVNSLICPVCDDAVEMEAVSNCEHVCSGCGYSEMRCA